MLPQITMLFTNLRSDMKPFTGFQTRNKIKTTIVLDQQCRRMQFYLATQGRILSKAFVMSKWVTLTEPSVLRAFVAAFGQSVMRVLLGFFMKTPCCPVLIFSGSTRQVTTLSLIRLCVVLKNIDVVCWQCCFCRCYCSISVRTVILLALQLLTL